MMQNILNSFSRLCVTSSRNVLIQSLPNKSLSNLINIGHPQQQFRFINKHAYLTEPGWKAFGNRWMVKFPEQYTLKKLTVQKLAGRDPITGKIHVYF